MSVFGHYLPSSFQLRLPKTFVTGTPVSTTCTQETVTVLLNGYAQTSEIVPLTRGDFTRPTP
jgi:hypothetical protein